MRDYIILNGVNSNTITGLLISTLPPITKPKIRTQTEEIDGRDGDIITKLGYSAYDKEIQIGLYGNFDINQVIAYFNTSGTVTFSNEPDKYYNYQILDQIDYEKLIRFKTAKVKMHVQPFKYPLEETPVEINIQNVTGSGETISINNTAEAPVTLALKGNTSQDGTPTPSTPIGIQVVSGDNSIDVCGKNRLKTSLEIMKAKNTAGTWNNNVYTYRQVDFTVNNDLSITINGTVTGGRADFFLFGGTTDTGDYIYIPQGTYSVYKTGLSDGTMFMVWREKTAGVKYTTNSNNSAIEIMASQDCYFYSVMLGLENNKSINNYTFYPMLVSGSTLGEYQPYTSQTYPISLGNIELCKIGTYQDYIYKDNNKWYIKRQVGKVVLDGTETDNMYIYGTSGGVNRISTNLFINLIMPYTDQARHIDRIISDYFLAKITDEVGSMYQYQNLVLFDTTSDITSVALWKQWLTTHNVTVYYVLADPEDEEITDNTLIGQLNALENARSYDPTTNISQNTPNKPFIINATAVQKGSDTGTVDNIGNIYAKPTIDIEGSGIVEIYLDGNQIFNVDLSTINECVIDTTNLEAYNPATTQLMNRQVTGDYSNFKINVGDNQVKVSGAVTKATISNYTRWL